MQPFALNAVATLAATAVLMAAVAWFAAAKNRHDVVDVVWGPGFGLIAVVSGILSAGHGDPARRLLAVALTVVWGVRLGLHIGVRWRGHDEDPRYVALLGRAPGSRTGYALKVVYLPQGAIMWFVSLPVQVACYETSAPGPVAAVGVAVWLVGFGFEAVGDWQLSRFRSDPAKRGRVMDRGLWRYTRHPNYFGDACVWWGLFLLACGHPVGLLTIASPLLMTYLLVSRTGKALLERRMSRSYPEYTEYVARTSGFLPRPPQR
jgi:steroid 5-alpha reductase family enzyme